MLLCELQVTDLSRTFDEQRASDGDSTGPSSQSRSKDKAHIASQPALSDLVALQGRGASRRQRLVLLHWLISLP
jgi:hypothetical protein